MNEFNPQEADRLARVLGELAPRGATPGLRTAFASASEQLRAACAEVERLRTCLSKALGIGATWLVCIESDDEDDIEALAEDKAWMAEMRTELNKESGL